MAIWLLRPLPYYYVRYNTSMMSEVRRITRKRLKYTCGVLQETTKIVTNAIRCAYVDFVVWSVLLTPFRTISLISISPSSSFEPGWIKHFVRVFLLGPHDRCGQQVILQLRSLIICWRRRREMFQLLFFCFIWNIYGYGRK